MIQPTPDSRGIVRNVNGLPAYCSLLRNHCFEPHCGACELWQPHKPELREPEDPVEWLMRRLSKVALIRKRVFKSYYKTMTGEWTEDETRAHWCPYVPHDDSDVQPWNKKFKSNIKGTPPTILVCDMKDKSCWVINDNKYYDYDEALQAMYDELFVKPVVIPMLKILIKQIAKSERRRRKLTAHYEFLKGAEA